MTYQVPEGPYTIDGIMESIRTQIVEAPAREAYGAGSGGENGGEGPVSSGGLDPDAPRPLIDDGTPISGLLTQIELMRQRQSTQFEYIIQSHRPLSGWFFDFLKKFIYWGARPFVFGMREKQEAFNESTLQAMREVSLRLEELQAFQQDLRMQLGQTRQDLEQTEQKLEQTEQELEQTQRELAKTERSLGGTIAKLQGRHDLGPFYESLAPETRLAVMDRNRGTFEDIQGRQNHYVGYFRGAPGQVLDIGCGRGELLALLRHEGIEAWGAEIDAQMIEQARGRDVYVVEKDALGALESAPDGKLGGLFAAQVVEHLFPGELLKLLQLARRKLAPGGKIILETINAASLGALAKSYFRDLDHKQPIHPEYMKSLLELAGFGEVTVHYLAPFRPEERLEALPSAEELGVSEAAREALQARFTRLDEQIYGMQDFYVVGIQGEPTAAVRRARKGRAASEGRA